jgi:hypothetical protein
MIVNKRKLVFEDLDTYEQRSKRYWDQRLDGGDPKNIDPLDADIEDELMELMKDKEGIDVAKSSDATTEAVSQPDLSITVSNGQTRRKVEETDPGMSFEHTGTEEKGSLSSAEDDIGNGNDIKITVQNIDEDEVNMASNAGADDEGSDDADGGEKRASDDEQEFEPVYE